ncbi:MAG: Smr/MutS family protein, partial [Rhodospirillales bacterium]|nr:Smr/MutS family protein [Rhodospirillales bacterium]
PLPGRGVSAKLTKESYKIKPLSKTKQKKPPARAAPSPAPSPPCRPLPDLAPGRIPGLDKRTAQRLRRGRFEPEARLDLHGMTQDQAHRALANFLARAQDKGQRQVLIITGKGLQRDGTIGILRAAVPRWLNEAPNRERVLGYTPAQPRDGGEGALYLRLRKRK